MVESRTQGSRPRPRTPKESEAKDSPSEDRPSRSQGQECSRPRTQEQVFSKKKFFKNCFSGEKGLKILFQEISNCGKQKKVFANFPRGFWRFPKKFQRFKKQCCPRAEDRAIFEDLRLRGQGQELQNDCVLEDSTSGQNPRNSNNLASKC